MSPKGAKKSSNEPYKSQPTTETATRTPISVTPETTLPILDTDQDSRMTYQDSRRTTATAASTTHASTSARKRTPYKSMQSYSATESEHEDD